mmetsp:Transcript_57438/g.181839  ORF Transcript_57438/g.181839 Transcript_57438/m.181839 type:complete len:311 (+) Transcript_57438:427-1359(+)
MCWITFCCLVLSHFIMCGSVNPFCQIRRRILKSQKKIRNNNYDVNEFDFQRALAARPLLKSISNNLKHAMLINSASCGQLGKSSLGSCAFVASSADIMKKEQGDLINSYDTIIRLGRGPVNSFEKYVGNRTDITLLRPTSTQNGCPDPTTDRWDQYRAHTQANPELNQPNHFFWLSKYIESCSNFSIPNYKPVCAFEPVELIMEAADILWKSVLPFIKISKGSAILLRRHSKGPNPSPTSGYTIVFNILGSNCCSTLGIFGFSRHGNTPHYFLKKQASGGKGYSIKGLHSIGAEYFILAELMRASLLCIF